ERGLPRLVAGSDPDIQSAARKDLENPKAAAAAVALGDQWWDIGQKQPAAAKRAVLRHAAEWYLVAMPGLAPNQRATAARRIEQAVPLRNDQLTALVKEVLVAHWAFDEGGGGPAQETCGTRSINHALLINAHLTVGLCG